MCATIICFTVSCAAVGAQSDLVVSIAELVDKGVIAGVSDVRDESDRTGMRLVVETKSGIKPEVTHVNDTRRYLTYAL